VPAGVIERSVEGRRALVTGADTGIGLATARALAEAGARVVLHSHLFPDAARAAARELVWARGNVARAIEADLSSTQEASRLVDGAVEFLGGLDILVNNAGMTRSVPFEEEQPEALAELVALNVGGAFACALRALPHLVASGRGAIVNLSSIHAFAGAAGFTAYACTKGAIVSFTKQLAIELAPKGVRVNAIAPGLIEVPRYFDIPGYTTEQGDRMVPIGRIGKPADVADSVLFLASDAASFITGAVLSVDGGTHAGMALDWRIDPEAGQGD
jgi:NAD(P)-dependent dehydrogenase (short-subunit alcohol dehydrogenase family)